MCRDFVEAAMSCLTLEVSCKSKLETCSAGLGEMTSVRAYRALRLLPMRRN